MTSVVRIEPERVTMGKEERLTRPQQYASVYSKGSSRTSRLLVMRALPNGLTFSRYGLSVSKRVGNAVTRNRLKRRLREILRIAPLKAGWDVVFIVRSAASDANYANLKKTAGELLSRSDLLTTEDEPGPPDGDGGI